jgi:hypothetical protein
MAYSKSNTTNVSFDGTSQSQDLSGKAKQIILSTTAACYVSFDSTVVSDTNGFLIGANTQYVFDVLYPPQISVIQSSGAGILSVMELGDAIPTMGITVKDDFTGDSSLQKTLSDTFDADSSLLIEISDTYTGDGHLDV